MIIPVKKLLPLLIIGVCAAFIGCSAESYRDSADLQIGKMLRDRQQKTLGYTPQVEVAKEIPSTPKRAYAKIPTSPIPPPTTAPITFQQVEVPRVPLGPETRWMEPTGPEAMPAGDEIMQRRLHIGGPGFAGPPTLEEYYRRYELMGLLEYAVRHSRAYRDQMEALYLAALDVSLQRHLFAPIPFVHQDLTYNGGQRDANYAAALTAATSAGMKQKLPYGGELVAETLVQFVNALSETATSAESAQLVLSGSLPLLRGAGMVNLEPLISSERELIYQVRTFEQYRRDFVVSIATQYFNLLAQYQGVLNRRISYANLVSLTERTQALYDTGRIIFLEVQRSLQSQLSAESALIDAEEGYQAALDNFKLRIGMPIDERLEIVPVELDVHVPKMTADEAVTLAHKYRLDLRTAADQVEDAQRGVSNARNGLLPDVNLTASAKLGNEPNTPASNLQERTLTYTAGIGIDLPIDRLAERNALRKALIAFQKSQRTYAQLKDQIAADVRDEIRAIRTAEASLEIQRRGIELAQNRLEYSNELLREGRGLARDVVESQSSLLDAQDSFERARAQLQIRVLQLMRDTGTLRVDPSAGAIGQAMDRAAPTTQPGR